MENNEHRPLQRSINFDDLRADAGTESTVSIRTSVIDEDTWTVLLLLLPTLVLPHANKQRTNNQLMETAVLAPEPRHRYTRHILMTCRPVRTEAVSTLRRRRKLVVKLFPIDVESSPGTCASTQIQGPCCSTSSRPVCGAVT